MIRVIGVIAAAVCTGCDLTRCPCPPERPVAFVRGVAAVGRPFARGVCRVPSSLRGDRARPQNTRPGQGRHRRPSVWSLAA